MLRWSFYAGATLYSLLFLVVFCLIIVIFKGNYDANENGFHLATLQTIITLCTLTSIFTVVREQTKQKLENILAKEILLYAPEVRNFIISSLKNYSNYRKAEKYVLVDIRGKIEKEIEILFKSLVLFSSISVLISIFIINIDCKNCATHHVSLILFLPTVFLCSIFLKTEYIAKVSNKKTKMSKYLYNRALKDFKIILSESTKNKIIKINNQETKEDIGQIFLDKTSKLSSPKPIPVHVIYYN